MRYLFTAILSIACTVVLGQPKNYTAANAHSHNDYENPVPFYAAYSAGFGSIEADIFLEGNELIVAHSKSELKYHRTLDDLYLMPLQKKVIANNGFAYADTTRQLQLMIDIKTDSIKTLDLLISTLKKYPALINAYNLKVVISGNRPDDKLFVNYPPFIWFDGELNKNYPAQALSKIVMLSDNLQAYTHWNGKGILTKQDKEKVVTAIKKAHSLHKTVRFWAAPDFINAWYTFMQLGVDYINTDDIYGWARFCKNLPNTTYLSGPKYDTYTPTYKSDGVNKPVKNIILFIGDGCSLPQLYAGYTANHADLNIFKIKRIGLSKTSSSDSYITDSAPGSTAIASGAKTNNRFVGVDSTGKALKLLPEYFSERKMKTGLITSGDITDATPADFYAHQTERDSSESILNDLQHAPIDLLMGSNNEGSNIEILKHNSKSNDNKVLQALSVKYKIVGQPDSVKADGGKYLVIDKQASLSIADGRKDWLPRALDKAVKNLNTNKNGFFLMCEGAQIDYGGHANQISYVAKEVADFDKAIGQALAFADADGQTLVIVTADHETGGLTLLNGDYGKGFVAGQFSTNDHTALPVPVFAYGPQSDTFIGVYENTQLFNKILKVLNIAK
jgi:alkaline phosphatase